MKSLTCLLLEVLRECGTLCSVSTTKDEEYVLSRVKDEGFSFLTITLPSFGKAFEASLEEGVLSLSEYAGFRKSARSRRLPAFLQGFVRLVFDERTGVLLDDPDIEAIRSVRQISLMLGKVNLPTTDRRSAAALSRFVECEQELLGADKSVTSEMRKALTRTAAVIWGDLFDKLNREIELGELVPAHGPGATADRLRGNAKYRQREWTSRLEEYFPSVDYLLPNHRYWRTLGRVKFLEPGAERPVRVITVPKTLKTPRIIAIEPTCMQYTQQAISRRLMELLEGPDNPYSQLVGFADQTVSHSLARRASSDGSMATLDLSEASDRVLNSLVEDLFRPWPALSGAIQACRSTRADVPGHGIIPLVKFASMGSALCFPIEAIVFATICFIGMHGLSTPHVLKTVRRFKDRVRVYGDDIIIPTDFTTEVIRCLEAYGLKVNSGKSFWNGRFRETCGGEFYDGHDVSIVRARRSLPSSHRDTPEVLSTASLRNHLYMRGYWRSAGWLDERIVKVLSSWPVVEPTSSGIGRWSFLPYRAERTCPSTHKPLVKAHVVRSVYPSSRLDGTGALLKVFLQRGAEPLNEGHLEYYGRPVAVCTKRQWVAPY